MVLFWFHRLSVIGIRLLRRVQEQPSCMHRCHLALLSTTVQSCEPHDAFQGM